jgi:DNA-binding transcriptional regulator LsrR (DeoR family)
MVPPQDTTTADGSIPTKGFMNLDFSNVLMRLERERWPNLGPHKDLAKALGVGSRSTYTKLRNGTAPVTLEMIVKIAKTCRIPLGSLFDAGSKELWFRNNKKEDKAIRWRVGGRSEGSRERALRMAADGLLLGRAPADIAADIQTLRSSEGHEVSPTASEIVWMAESGFQFGLVRISFTYGYEDAYDLDLTVRLEKELRQAANSDSLRVIVVKNMAHSEFGWDPAARMMMTRVAHALVRERLTDGGFTIGISGGAHVGSFVHSVDAQSSFFPDVVGSDRRYVLVPLTLEPFYAHDYKLADALVGELHWRTSALVGSDRVRAPSFKPTGHLVNRRPGSLEPDSIIRVREHYSDLDVAIFGCGNLELYGWAKQAMREEGVEGEAEHITDVCLTPLDREGKPLRLIVSPGSADQNLEYLGVNLDELRAVASDAGKLALMMTSGENKGTAVVAVAKSGAADTIIIDQRAANAALAALQ